MVSTRSHLVAVEDSHNYGMDVDQDDEDEYNDEYDYVDLDNLPND